MIRTFTLLLTNKEEWTTGIHTIEQCTDVLYNWLSHNGLALNLSKFEAVKFSVVQTLYTKDLKNVNVSGASIALSPSIKSLSVILDAHLTFDDHVAAVSKACYFYIRALHHIRASLSDDVAKTVARSIVSSRFDYCNSLLVGMSETNFSKLQCVQNTLARVFTDTKRYDYVNKEVIHIAPVLTKLHWLHVKSRIQNTEYRMCLL